MSNQPDFSSHDVVHRPSRFLKLVFDAPSWLYRLELGWALGTRFLALTHRGRRSGQTRRTILEVLAFDPDTRESVVASAYGTDADWYQNLQAEPALRIETGRWDYAPRQRFLTTKEAEEAAGRFCLEHPWEAKLVPRVLPTIGANISTDPDVSPAAMLASLPMVAFRPGDGD